ncbi:hypothetical protein BDA99DRAFT_559218 [Phascolomyces articulosus]|uniref:Uncharacterized protein n=1 Tax=Phascolomyces articulosus TaxID=60185 RepID=A0AAD5KC01_9FUNG|nr:hypothetical protein BDA99DRAFT_559218 [Phascolomyces articulosus]
MPQFYASFPKWVTVMLAKRYQKGKSSGPNVLDFHNDENDDTDGDDTDGDENCEGAVYKGIVTRMRKRRFKALENISNTIMEQIESDGKKIKSFEKATQFATTLPKTSCKEFELVEAQRSDTFTTYIVGIEKVSSSVHALQTAIRTSPILPPEMEISHTSTNNTKWDGLGLPVGNELAASVVSEFADGIRSGTIIKLPNTEVELKTFASHLPRLLQWRDTVVAHTQSFQDGN